MNDTEYILIGVLAFGLGWFAAYLVKNLGRIMNRWGSLIGGFYILIAVVYSLFLIAAITDMQSVFLSSLLAIGFLIRFFKNKGETS